jgi:hypothetical protein
VQIPAGGQPWAALTPRGGGMSARAPTEDGEPAQPAAAGSLLQAPSWFAAAAVYSAVYAALSPVWSYAAGLRAARQLLRDYSELKVLYREKKRTEMRREWIREDDRLAKAGVDTSGREMPNWDDLIPRTPHPAVVRLEAATASLLRTAMDAAHAHRNAASEAIPAAAGAEAGAASAAPGAALALPAVDTSSEAGIQAAEHAARVAVLDDCINSLFNGAAAL